MKKIMLVVAVSLSALAGCAADTADETEGGSTTRERMIFVDTKAPVVLPAEPANPWATAIAGQGPEREIELQAAPTLIRPENIRLPDLSRGGLPCENCVRVVDPLDR